MTYWNDFNNTTEEQLSSYGIIPSGTIAKVRMTIKPGGYNDEALALDGGYATKSMVTGAIYLDAEFIILEGQYAKRKVWSLIGLQSSKGPEWTNMGRHFIKSMLNSAKGISPKDISESAAEARTINSFSAIDGTEFVARIDITSDKNGSQKNEIRTAITGDHKDYAVIMGKVSAQANYQHPSTQSINNNINNSNRSNWA